MKFKPGDFVAVRSKAPWRVLFFGTDEFSLGTLKALHENSLLQASDKRVVDTLHIAHPWTKKPTPVTRYATLCDILGHEWPNVELGKRHHYDVGVLASFGHLIPKRIVEAFPYGILNVHPSLLPRWRGAAPLHHTILNGDVKTGISIMSIRPKHFDIGPLACQKEFDVPSTCTTTRLRDRLADEGGKMIIEVLSRLPEALVEETPQPSEGVTYAHKITPSMAVINWENQTVDSIDRQYRALHETEELRTDWEGTTVRLIDKVDDAIKPAVPLEESSPPGLPIFDKLNDILWVKCQDGWVAFKHVVIRKKMSAKSFYNGYLSKKYLQGVAFKSAASNEEYQHRITQQKPS
ncbi:unnamed protein product [Candidula unifasciata]|uniref:Methionyl-tRNA formyltransferase, mitochondrial n=1 Tax=Candidula unifasciata TaxID=100452 RepID=A0A8S3YML7_9EUPU|nr:unnamed protein product [Candidula unifasciata]